MFTHDISLLNLLMTIIGGRTAWSAIVTVDGMGACSARHWYDGTYLNNAKEDAAEVALLKMGVDTVPS